MMRGLPLLLGQLQANPIQMRTIPFLAGSILLTISFAAPAATIVYYQSSAGGNGTTGAIASDYHDDLNDPTTFGPAAGSGVNRDTGVSFSGFGTSINPLQYAGFKISALPDHELHLTQLVFGTLASSGGVRPVTSYSFGYRIDLNNDGSYSGAGEEWVMGKLYTPVDSDFSLGNPFKTWDLNIVTTGEVEFGLFASAPQANGRVVGTEISVLGDINAVPEPSAALLGALGGLALLRRRR
ncbi:hypothetical protein [Luteolibacter sp. Populi]|uniref:hypothetical protein n=1 Tax=Luteolibacter sp. Populi TaxID=3230487 RepID=UPI003465B795